MGLQPPHQLQHPLIAIGFWSSVDQVSQKDQLSAAAQMGAERLAQQAGAAVHIADRHHWRLDLSRCHRGPPTR